MRPPIVPADSLRNRGFTLIEVMIAIAVLGIMSSIAVPYFREMIASQRVRSTASDAYGGLLLARSEAMKRNATAAMTANDAADWTQGWKVGITGTDFLNQAALDNGMIVDGPDTGAIGFLWTGRPDTDSVGARIKVSSSVPGVQARCIQLSLSGMPENKLC